MHKGRLVPARVETVVLFLPDVWSCNPSRIEWDALAASYKRQLAEKYKEDTAEETQAPIPILFIFQYITNVCVLHNDMYLFTRLSLFFSCVSYTI